MSSVKSRIYTGLILGLRLAVYLLPSFVLAILASLLLWSGRLFLIANRISLATLAYCATVALQTRETDVAAIFGILSRQKSVLHLDLNRVVGVYDRTDAQQLIRLASAIVASGDADATISQLQKIDWSTKFDLRRFYVFVDLHLQRNELEAAHRLLGIVSKRYAILVKSKTAFESAGFSDKARFTRFFRILGQWRYRFGVGLVRSTRRRVGRKALKSPVEIWQAYRLPTIFWCGYKLFALAFQNGELELASSAHRDIIRIAAYDGATRTLASLAHAELASACGDYDTALLEFAFLLDEPKFPLNNSALPSALHMRVLFGMMHIKIARGGVEDMVQFVERYMKAKISDDLAWRNILFFFFRHRRTSEIQLLHKTFDDVGDVRNLKTAEYFLRLSQFTEEEERRLSAQSFVPNSRRRRFFLIIPVWGTDYVQELVKIAIPTLLARGNISEFSTAIDLEVLFYIDQESLKTLEAAPIFAVLKSHVQCRVVVLPHFFFDESYAAIWGQKITILAFVHWSALMSAKSESAGVIFWSPDIICSDNYFLTLKEILRSDREVIFCCHLRIDRRLFYRQSRLEIRSAYGTPSLTRADINAMVQDDFLPALRSHVYNSGIQTTWPSLIMWRVPKRGFVVRAFHNHPLLFTEGVVDRYAGQIFFSNDSDLLPLVMGDSQDFSKWHVMSGLEPAIACQLTSSHEEVWRVFSRGFSDKEIAHYGYRQSTVAHWLFGYPIVAGTDDSGASKIGEEGAERIFDQMKTMEKMYGLQPYVAGYWMPIYPRIMP